MTTPPAPEKFIVCAWNALADKSGEEWQDDPIALAVIGFLNAIGWTGLSKPEDEKDAGLVIIAPRDRDKPMTVEDLAVFHAGLGGSRKKVLYIHVAPATTFSLAGVAQWLFVIQRGDFDVDALKEWLGKKFKDDAKKYPLKQVREEISSLHKRAYMTLAEGKAKPAKSGLSFGRTCSCLIAKTTCSQVFYGLYRLAGKYNVLEHDINARLSVSPASGNLAFGQVEDIARKQLLDGYFDLRSAIAAHASFFTLAERMDCDPADKVCRNVVLLVDDRPEKQSFAAKVYQILQAYLPELELWIWNPDDLPLAEPIKGRARLPKRDSKSPRLLQRRDVEQYSSLDEAVFGRDDEQDKIWALRIRRVTGKPGATLGKPVETPLELILARTRIVLVDLLFSDALGNDVEAGLGLIRGWQRICLDHGPQVERHISQNQSRPDNEAKDDKERGAEWTSPEIVAISRASDLTKAHAVFRYGAGGFLPKDRLLGLPAMIARNFRASPDSVKAAHRNFRLLYSLPHEAIMLLHDVRVPQVLFHQQVADAAASDDRTVAIARLLTALPKTDLHVHPGSCMSPEFLVAASLIMLLRHDPEAIVSTPPNHFVSLRAAAKVFASFWAGSTFFTLCPQLEVGSNTKRTFGYGRERWNIEAVANHVREYLLEQLEICRSNRKEPKPVAETEARYLELRSVLHKSLGVPDHHDLDKAAGKLKKLPCTAIFFFAMLHAGPAGKPLLADDDNGKADLLRLFILWLASGGEYGEAKVVIGDSQVPVGRWFSSGQIDKNQWRDLRNLFYGKNSPYGVVELRRSGWRIPRDRDIEVSVRWKRPELGLLASCPDRKNDPIAWVLASGTRATNLREYLEGCEYSGAEHVKHPFLLHLFAQQAIHQFVEQGVLYAELRAAIVGYENTDLEFSFADACVCLCEAFGQAQRIVLAQYQDDPHDEDAWLWRGLFEVESLFEQLRNPKARIRFPCKASIILTGKRHKSSRMLLREAGAGAVMHSRPANPANSARDFVNRAIPECRVVGFDLAGQEDDHHPHDFRSEYEQLARLHIPVTVHAGENAPVDFVESAILDLRARRLGHGLSLADDKLLMARARDDGICVELCPISNFQTNAVLPHGQAGAARVYPLREFLKYGIVVCINTDNPVISCTNMVKECFQASYAFGKPGLSLWDILRILRLGFTQSFLSFPERRAMLELADQILFDLFSSDDIVSLLRELASRQ